MKRAIFLFGFCSALLPPGAWADIAEPRFRHIEFFPPPTEKALADVMGATGGIEVGFQLAGPGTCDYTLRGPQSEAGPGPVVAKGSLTSEKAGENVLVEKVPIAPEPKENVKGRYHLEALCRVEILKETNFGTKETGQVEEIRLMRTFSLRRESVYHVSR